MKHFYFDVINLNWSLIQIAITFLQVLLTHFLRKSFLMKLSEKYFEYFTFSLTFWPMWRENDKFAKCKNKWAKMKNIR